MEIFKHINKESAISREENNTYDERLGDRLLCLQRDVWSNSSQDAFLGNNLTGIITSPTWQLITFPLGCTSTPANTGVDAI